MGNVRSAASFRKRLTTVTPGLTEKILIDNYRNLWDGFPGLVRRVDRWTFGENACVIELTLSGTHDGPYRGIAPTGKALELRICAHFAFADDGRIVRETAYYDSLTFMRHLGLSRG